MNLALEENLIQLVSVRQDWIKNPGFLFAAHTGRATWEISADTGKPIPDKPIVQTGYKSKLKPILLCLSCLYTKGTLVFVSLTVYLLVFFDKGPFPSNFPKERQSTGSFFWEANLLPKFLITPYPFNKTFKRNQQDSCLSQL